MKHFKQTLWYLLFPVHWDISIRQVQPFEQNLLSVITKLGLLKMGCNWYQWEFQHIVGIFQRP